MMLKQSEKTGDRTQGKRDLRKYIWAFCDPFLTVAYGTREA